jgi:phage-related protein
MSLPVFDWVESPGTSKRTDPITHSTKFGDGYVQDSPAGLNARMQTWTYQASGIDVEVADAIEAFLEDGIGVKRFNWTPPRKTTALVFKCTAFSYTLSDVVGQASITATFEQVFES